MALVISPRVTGSMLKPLILGLLLTGQSLHSLADSLPLARQQALEHLLLQDCGSCHGMTLRGGLGPALLPDQLRVKDPEALARIIRDGLPGTAMPPWGPLLSSADIEWLASRLLHSPSAP